MRPKRPLHWLLLSLAIAVTAAVYATSLHFAFVYDDHNQIESNPAIQSWQYWRTWLTGHVWVHKTGLALYYRPVFMLWLALNYSLFGANPAGWHASTVALHLVCTLLVYFLAARLTGERYLSVAAALLFGVWPAHVEAVAWVSGVTEPLFGALLAGSFLAFLKRHEGRGWLAVSLALAALALLAKETAVALPLLIFAYAWMFARSGENVPSRGRQALAASFPYAALTFAYLIVRTLALKTFAHRMPMESALEPVFTAPSVVAFYIRHTLIPAGLSVFYNFSPVLHPGLRNFIVPLAIVLFALAALVWWSSRSRIVAFLALWIGLLLAPMLSLTVYGNGELVHDRYLYVPSMGFCILAASGVWLLRPSWARIAVVAAIGCVYAFGTVQEEKYWANGVALNRRGLEIAPGNITATHNLGVELMGREQRWEAIPYFLAVLDTDPKSDSTLFALGLCYYELNMLPDAQRYLQRAIEANPADPKAHLFLGVIWDREHQVDLAELEMREAIRLQRIPTGYKRYHLALGAVLAEKGDLEGALREFEAELAADPESSDAQAGIDSMHEQMRGRKTP